MTLITVGIIKVGLKAAEPDIVQIMVERAAIFLKNRITIPTIIMEVTTDTIMREAEVPAMLDFLPISRIIRAEVLIIKATMLFVIWSTVEERGGMRGPDSRGMVTFPIV
jgi:hypothetical protein